MIAAVAIAAWHGIAVAVAAPWQVAMMEGASNCVALTFDDGPDADLTPQLLTILETKGVVATFFVVGYRAALWPEPVVRANRDGYEIGNHSWSHPQLPNLESAAALRELTRTDDMISHLIGHLPAYTRAPYGALANRVAALTPRTFVAWNVDTLDYRFPDVARITNVAVSKAVNGSIILMHDVHPTTIAAVPGIIDGLHARGFRLVTVSELLGGSCGGHPIGFDLPGMAPPAPAVSSASPRAPVAPASPAMALIHPKREAYRIHDDEE